jgi:2-dehydro-3-deoxygluconokinase
MGHPDIVALGEPMIEFNQIRSGEASYQQGFGGDTTNFAIAVARQGVSSGYLTKLGNDVFGKMFMRLWQGEGVDTRGVQFDPGAHTAVYFVSHSEAGHSFNYLRAGSAASRMTPSDFSPELIINARSATACDTVFAAIEQARKAGVAVSYDPNLRLKLWPLPRARAIIRATISLCDYFLPSIDDARVFSGCDDDDAVLDWCFSAGAKNVLLKLGKEGVIVATASQRTRIPGFTVNAVDATGAGDCFGGALVARLSRGDELLVAARYANAAAALTTTGYGAIAPIPHAEQVLALLKESR